MRYASLFAGIEGFGVGFERAGMVPTCRVEINKDAQKVLAHHWPDVPLLDDIKEVTGGMLGDPELFVGGFPCQNISRGAPRRVRKGIAHGDRSSLFLEFARLIDEYQRLIDECSPRWVVIENVVDLLASGWRPAPGVDEPDPDVDEHWVADLGADHEAVVRSLAELGYVGCWRVVDTRLVRGASVRSVQQRRRVIVVGHRGPFPGAGEVLADAEGGGADPRLDHEGRGDEPRRPSAGASASPGGDGLIQVFRKSRNPRSKTDYATWLTDGRANTLNTFDNGMARTKHLVVDGDRVRILTMEEKEKLQGFPPGWTDVGLSDGARERLLGNAVSTNVSEWVGRRLMAMPAVAAVSA